MNRATYESLVAKVPILGKVFAESAGMSVHSGNFGAGEMNFAEGIPIQFATPYDEQGLHALRNDVNAIGSLASRELLLRQKGGYHTYDERVAEIIDGYGEGAFLDYFDIQTGWMRKVRCIKPGGRCFSGIDDDEHGVRSGDPYWEFVDFNDQCKEPRFALGDKRSIVFSFPNEGSLLSDRIVVPCNCLGRIVVRVYGKLFAPSAGARVVEQQVELLVSDRGGIQRRLALGVVYGGWSANAVVGRFAGYFRAGTEMKIRIGGDAPAPQYIDRKGASMEYKEVTEQ